MKRIISALIICAMLCASLFAVIPASAANATREQLKEQIDIAEALVQENYTAATWTNLQNNLTNAKNAYDNANTGAYMINMQYEALVGAIAGLQVETKDLVALINKAAQLEEDDKNAKKNGYEEGDYTADSWTAFMAVVAEAKEARNSNNIETVKAATEKLGAAFDTLVKNPVPEEMKTKLDEYLELADILVSTEYSDSAWGMVEIKVEQGKNALNDPRISVYLIAVTQLETALKNLTEDKVLPTPPVLDYDYIDGLFAHIDNEFTEDMFTAESWTALRAAYDAAKKVRETSKKQAEIDAASVALYNAQKNMVPAPQPEPTEPAPTEPQATEPVASTGCGGFVATSVAVVAVVSVLGTAVALKKKED